MGNTLPNLMPKGMTGPMRLYVGSLHFNITEDMLRGIFEPFGKIDNIQLIMDPETGRSKGYGFITVSIQFLLEMIIISNFENSLMILKTLIGKNVARSLCMYLGHLGNIEETDSPTR